MKELCIYLKRETVQLADDSPSKKTSPGTTNGNCARQSFRASPVTARRLLDSFHRRNHRPDSSRGPVCSFRLFFCRCDGNLESFFQSSRGNASQRNAHSVRTHFSFRLSLFFCGRELAVLCAFGEFRLARN